MALLELARVLVIDDQPEEVAELLRALRQEGVWAVYINPDSEDAKSPVPLEGVRIVFLDMHLQASAPRPAATAVAQLAQWVPEGEPFIVILWTNYPEEKELLEKEIEKLKNKGMGGPFAGLLGIHAGLDKKASVQEIRKWIMDILEQHAAPFGVLLAWEQSVNAAAAGAVREMPAGQKKPAEFLATSLNSLGKAVQGREWPSGDHAQDYQDMFSGLTFVFMDYLERQARLNIPPPEIVSRVTSSGTNIPEETVAGVNRYLLVQKAQEEKPAPGAVITDFGICRRYPFDPGKLIHDMFDGKPDWGDLQQKMAPVLVEITPLCDFVQKKHCDQLRFIGGGLLEGLKEGRSKSGSRYYYLETSGPQQKKVPLKRSADFLKRIGPFCLPGHSGKIFHLVLDAHFIHTCSETTCRWKPAFFLRTQVLTDILAWFGRQVSRPGMLSAG